jgi:hypothetical protein
MLGSPPTSSRRVSRPLLQGRRPLPAGPPRLQNLTFKSLFTSPPSVGSFHPLNPPLLNPHQGHMAIDGHGRRESPLLPSQAYINTPRASTHPPSLAPELPHLPRWFSCIQLSSPPSPLKFGRRRQFPPPSTSRRSLSRLSFYVW